MPARIVFMGSPDFAVPSLHALCKTHDVVAVYTQPPRKKGRGMKQIPTPVEQAATQANIPCFSPKSLRPEEQHEKLKAFQADLFIVVAYGQILSRAVLDIPPLGCVNAHASLLPRWRGAAPIQRAIEAGDNESGISAMLMAEGLDTGPVLNQYKLDISADMTAGQLHDALAKIAPTSLLQAVDDLMMAAASPTPQHEDDACYAAKISTSDAHLNLSQNAEILSRKIRAFSPSPGAFMHSISGRLKLLDASPAADKKVYGVGIFGGRDTEGRMLIGCADGAIAIKKLQLAGKKPMGVADFLNGQNWSIGQHILADEVS